MCSSHVHSHQSLRTDHHLNSSAVIEDLLAKLSADETLAYFYCDFRDPRTTRTKEVLRSLIAQLLRNARADWLASFTDLVARKDRGADPPADVDMLSDLLKRAAGLHARPIIVIDALDECDDLPDLLGALMKLNDGHCRVFVTSRTVITIKEKFSKLPSISLNDMVKAVSDDMRLHIKTELESRSRLKILRADLKEEIKDLLMRKADGMCVASSCSPHLR